MRMKRSLLPDPLLAETFGALPATIFGYELRLSSTIILEGDSLQVIQAISKVEESCTTSNGMLFISDIRSKLQKFRDWSVHHVRRDVNVLAHVLAKDALHISDVIVDMLCVTWCRNPLYDADFGWGKPTWVTVATMVLNNPIVLMDTRDGSGIEAWITLSEEDMALFEHDKELLEFASFNPSVLN
ncbi:hypothetical protein F2P56_011344 [Juglans regia]|uniref:RNase H type-1 domain-containing protein n=1 Tax=Juglans regia TaxID=51240 RepID=A0A834D0Z6_JUGRE|nr:hypothetical protein F2P56_011344 [Juglans regia]